MKTAKTIIDIISTLFYITVIVLVFITVSANTQLLGKGQSFVIKSGSMEPTIMTGDIIMISSQPQYNKNDVVTFKDAGERIVTHRIIDVQDQEELSFVTKGDANRSIDNDVIQTEDILGKVTFVIPKIGFLVGFTQTLPGFLVMVIIPAVLLALDQLVSLAMKDKAPRRLSVHD